VKRVVRLRVVGGDEVALREGVPATRADCKDGPRPCPFYRCKHHLWFVVTDDRPGNPWQGRGPSSELEPRWLEWPTPASCALDVAESVPPGEVMMLEEVGVHLGRSGDVAELILERALGKLRDHRDIGALPSPEKNRQVRPKSERATRQKIS